MNFTDFPKEAYLFFYGLAVAAATLFIMRNKVTVEDQFSESMKKKVDYLLEQQKEQDIQIETNKREMAAINLKLDQVERERDDLRKENRYLKEQLDLERQEFEKQSAELNAQIESLRNDLESLKTELGRQTPPKFDE